MSLSLIVAMAENGVIGHQGRLPWHLSTDLRRFKRLTMGHHLLMGRKTFESLGRLLPGRTSVIMTRQPDFQIPGALISADLDSALELCRADDQVFVIGGGQIYSLVLPYADRLYLTLVHGQFLGDTYFQFDESQWQLVEETRFQASERDSHDHTFRILERVER